MARNEFSSKSTDRGHFCLDLSQPLSCPGRRACTSQCYGSPIQLDLLPGSASRSLGYHHDSCRPRCSLSAKVSQTPNHCLTSVNPLRKLVLAILIIGVAAVTSASGAYYYVQSVASRANQPSLCRDPSSISSHVYHPNRLQQIKPCIIASGIVDNVFAEDDGDYHVRLALDSQYENLTNGANQSYQYGDLIVEIICATTINQQDAFSACQGYTNSITIPIVNDHITVTGPYVLDTNHYNWAEIHPVYSLTIS